MINQGTLHFDLVGHPPPLQRVLHEVGRAAILSAENSCLLSCSHQIHNEGFPKYRAILDPSWIHNVGIPFPLLLKTIPNTVI